MPPKVEDVLGLPGKGFSGPSVAPVWAWEAALVGSGGKTPLPLPPVGRPGFFLRFVHAALRVAPPEGEALVSTQLAFSCNLSGCKGWHSPQWSEGSKDGTGCWCMPIFARRRSCGRGAEPVRCQLGLAPPQATCWIRSTTTVAGTAPEQSSWFGPMAGG